MVLNNSYSDNKFIGARDEVSSLEIIRNNVFNTTSVKLSILDRSAPSNFNSYTLNLSGSWNYSLSSTDTLSCHLIQDTSSQVFAFLRFVNNTFEKIAEITPSEIPMELSGMMNSYSISYNSYLGEYCNIVSFNGYYYTIHNDTLAAITLPTGGMGMNRMKSESMTYMFSDYSLYKYSALSNSYVSVFTLPYFNRYELYTYQNRIIIVAASNNYDYQTGGQLLTESIYVLLDNNGIVEMVDIVTFSFPTYNYWVPITFSPQLTKFYYQYTTMYSSDPVFGLKTVDYTNIYVYDVSIIDQVHFAETIKSLNASNATTTTSYNSSNNTNCNFKLGDQFFVIRNDSSVSANGSLLNMYNTYNTSNSTNSSTVPPVYVE